MRQFTCKNMPLEHNGDMSCPHCSFAMHLNDWMQSYDAGEYIKDMRQHQPELTALLDGDVAELGAIGGLAMLAAEMIATSDNAAMKVTLEGHFQNVFNLETLRHCPKDPA